MLTEGFFPWPYGEDLGPAIADLKPLFLNSPLAVWANPNPAGSIVEFICLLCREWNVNPWWIVVSGEREQSIFTRKDLPPQAAAAWLGYVGQDQGRIALPGYYGLFAQLERMVPQTAWYLNLLPDCAWPEHANKDHDLRFVKGGMIKVKQADGSWLPTAVNDAGLWAQYQYTPHVETPGVNWRCAQKLVPSKFLGV